MSKFATLLLILILMVALVGCGQKDLYRTDTVIYIPADPTTEATELLGEEAETELTEVETEATKPTLSFFSYFEEKDKKESSETASKTNKTSTTTKPADWADATMATTLPPETDPQETEFLIYDISDYEVGFLELSMMEQVNSHRRDAGLAELEKSHRLSAIASVRAYEACLSWSHTRPDGSDYTTVFQDYGFTAGAAGENLLYTSGNEDGSTLVSKWMGAETNRDNLMYGGFTTMGIGVYKANGYVYIACLLAG